MQGAKFIDASFEDADLGKAKCQGTRFEKCGLLRADFSQAEFDAGTVLSKDQLNAAAGISAERRAVIRGYGARLVTGDDLTE